MLLLLDIYASMPDHPALLWPNKSTTGGCKMLDQSLRQADVANISNCGGKDLDTGCAGSERAYATAHCKAIQITKLRKMYAIPDFCQGKCMEGPR
jgi:hypothetical protein